MTEKISSRFKTNNNNSLNKSVEETIKPSNNEFRQELLDKINSIPVWFEYSKEKQKELVVNFLENKIHSENLKITTEEKDNMVSEMLKTVYDFGAIQHLLDNENVSSVIVNGTNSVHIEINGKILNTDEKLSEKQLSYLLHTIQHLLDSDISSGFNKFVTDKYYITIIGKDISKNGINIHIKKIKEFEASTLINNGMLTKDVFDFILSLIYSGKNIILSGGINSGKTILLDAILKNSLHDKRVYLLENNQNFSANFDTLVKFKTNNNYYEELIIYIQKSYPDYFISDLNIADTKFSDINCRLITLRSNSIDEVIKEFTSAYINAGFIDKYARQRFLTDYDYIIQLRKNDSGNMILDSISELVPAKTLSASIKTIVKYTEGKYISDIPQPLTSMRIRSISANN